MPAKQHASHNRLSNFSKKPKKKQKPAKNFKIVPIFAMIHNHKTVTNCYLKFEPVKQNNRQKQQN